MTAVIVTKSIAGSLYRRTNAPNARSVADLDVAHDHKLRRVDDAERVALAVGHDDALRVDRRPDLGRSRPSGKSRADVARRAARSDLGPRKTACAKKSIS
jgi:hypothetical protein